MYKNFTSTNTSDICTYQVQFRVYIKYKNISVTLIKNNIIQMFIINSLKNM